MRMQKISMCLQLITTDIGMRRYRLKVETDGNVAPLQWLIARVYAEPRFHVQRYPYTPVTADSCERLFSLAGKIVNKKGSELEPRRKYQQISVICFPDYLNREIF